MRRNPSSGSWDVTRLRDSLKRGFPHSGKVFIAFLVLQVPEPLSHLQYLSIPSEIDEKCNLSQFSNWPYSAVISHSSSCLYMQDLSWLVRWNFAWRQLWWIWPQVLLGGLWNEQDDAFAWCTNSVFIKKIKFFQGSDLPTAPALSRDWFSFHSWTGLFSKHFMEFCHGVWS